MQHVSGTMICSACGSPKMVRIERSLFEKLKRYLGSSIAPYKKYQCEACFQITTFSGTETQAQPLAREVEDTSY